MIDDIITTIENRFLNAVDFVTDPLWRWYFYGTVILLAVGVVSYFLPFKWVRAGLGAFLVLVGAFILGGRQMHKDMKAEVDKARAKAAPPPASGGGWFNF